jgi:hypothetical protein
VIAAMVHAPKIGQGWTNSRYVDTWVRSQRGSAIDAHKLENSWMREDPEYKPFTQPIEHYADMNDDELHEAAKKMVAVNTRDHFVDIDQKTLEAFNRQGGPRKVDSDVARTINPETTEDFDFGGDFAAGKSADHYSKTFYENADVQKAVKSGNLGQITSDDLPERAAAYIDNQQNAMEDAHEQGQPALQQARNIAGALMAHQLWRHYHLSRGNRGGGGGQIAPQHILPTSAGVRRGDVGGFQPSGLQSSLTGRLVPYVIPAYNPLS